MVMDFFQVEKRAKEEFLREFEDDAQMYFWPLADAFQAATLIFSVIEPPT